MTAHTLIFTGDGYRCDRCRSAWDMNEDAPEECVFERDPNTDDLFDELFDELARVAVDMMLDQRPYVAAAAAFQGSPHKGAYATGGVVSPNAVNKYLFAESSEQVVPVDDCGRRFWPLGQRIAEVPAVFCRDVVPPAKDPSIKQGFTDLVEQLRNPKPPTMTTQVGGRHYAEMAIQPTEFCMKNGWDFCLGAILKYLSRYRVKNGVEDLRKAKHFVEIRQGYAAHAEPPRCRLITMNTYVFENGIKREDSYAMILLDEYASSTAHHMTINADRLVNEIDKLIDAQVKLDSHRERWAG